MTPAARLSAAIGVLDRVLAGSPAEQALLGWARGSRYAGAADRAAVRDLVFAALRCRRSHAALGGAETGRGLILGGLVEAGLDPAALFTGEGHAPAPLSEAERAHLASPPALPELVALDCPDWLAPLLRESLGEHFAPVLRRLRSRAPVVLRANLARTTRAAAVAALSAEGIATKPHPLAAAALEVTAGARRVQASAAFRAGLVELQDAASQAVVEAIPLEGVRRILDLCAGGGGKALALAARAPAAEILAYDVSPARMRDLPARAARAGARLRIVTGGGLSRAGRFDLVFADVPCSGSGAWRRQPEAKWRLTPARLAELQTVQDALLDQAAELAAPGGMVAYATCSLLDVENGARVAAFQARRPGWRVLLERRFTPLEGGDGFYLAVLTRASAGP